MAQNSHVGWTHHTFNFWWGCTKVSPECQYRYISGIMKRAGQDPFNGPMRTKHWTNPLKWNRNAKNSSVRERVFTCSMSDFFHEGADHWRDDAWSVIRDCTQLDWLILTKRSERIVTCLPPDWGNGFNNVWLGVTCGHPSSYHRLEDLTRIPAHVRFISAEPLLDSLNPTHYLEDFDWVITGGEQAAKAKRRTMNLDWVRSVDQQCRDHNVAHFFKQYYENEMGTPVTDGRLDGEVR